MLHAVNLITQTEDQGAFHKQQQLLDLYTIDRNPDHLVRLALLLYQPPIADYDSAVRLLSNVYEYTKNEKALVIGSYISVANTGIIAPKLKFLIGDDIEMMNSDYQSACFYLLALESMIQFDDIKACDFFKKAIDKNKDCVLAYCYLSRLSPLHKKELLETAKSNILDIQSLKHIEMLPKECFISPESFIQEHIFGTIMTEEQFDFFMK